MPLSSFTAAQELLQTYVTEPYQLLHAEMVATAMRGYAETFHEEPELWAITGLLHDLDYQQHPETHPAPSLRWFRDWGYPEELVHAVEAHAYGYHGFTILPQTKLAAALLACDEMTGIFYAYRKMNPVRYGDMKASSILKKFKDSGFAAKIDRKTIELGCERLGLSMEEHVANLVKFLAVLP